MKTHELPKWARQFRPLVEQLEDRLVPGETLGALQSFASLLGPLVQLLGPGILLGNNLGAAENTRVVEAADVEILGQTSSGSISPRAEESIWTDVRPEIATFDDASDSIWGGQHSASGAGWIPVVEVEQPGESAPVQSTMAPDSPFDQGPFVDDLLTFELAWDRTDSPGLYRANAGLSGINGSGGQQAGSSGGSPAIAQPHGAVSSQGSNAPRITSGGMSEADLLSMFATSQQSQQTSGSSLESVFAQPMAHGDRSSGPAGYSPAQIRHAYGFDQLSVNGSGITIAIVDAFHDPTAFNDLNVFSTQFGLPTATLNTPGPNQFKFIQAFAQGSQPKTNAGWAQEISLDVQWAHAIAPKATIMLVETADNSFDNLLGGVDYAVANGAKVVSMSWGANDFAGESAYDSHFNVSGVAFVASAGDSGGVVEYPSASPYVLSVGGTHLPLDKYGNRITTNPETAWSSGGGGVSSNEALPTYQSSYGLTYSGRATPDVAYDADPNTGVAVYDSTRYLFWSGWQVFGGTSIGAPQWAGLIALADQSRPTPLATNDLTSSPAYNAAGSSNYRDITSGSNGFSAASGYDLATGLGSPVASSLVPYLANP
jgi:hypothetical protein